ncbi:MAG: hypothetical protein ACI9EW_000776 [Cellvibrionaceae bacterium]
MDYLLDQLITVHETVCEKLYVVADYQDWRPSAGSWSFRLIGAHLAKLEAESYLFQLDGMIKGSGQTFSHYWNTEEELGRPELTDSIVLWKERRRKFVERIKNLGLDSDELTAEHDVYGTITPDRLIEIAMNHDTDHLSHLIKIMKQFDAED